MSKKRNKPNDLSALSSMMSGQIQETELTEHQQLRLKRVKSTYPLLLEAKSTYQIIELLQSEYDISQAQAYRDIDLCQQLFGNIRKSNKEFKRHMAEEMALETYRMAKDEKDLKVMASATKAYIEASGCNIEDPDRPDFEGLQPNVYPIIIDDQQKTMLMRLLSGKGSINLSKMRESVEEIDYEDVPNPNDKKGDSATT